MALCAKPFLLLLILLSFSQVTRRTSQAQQVKRESEARRGFREEFCIGVAEVTPPEKVVGMRARSVDLIIELPQYLHSTQDAVVRILFNIFVNDGLVC